MDITEVKVFPVREDKLKAFVSIVFDGCFMVNDIKVIRGKDGLFISMPSRKKKNGEFKDVAHPLNNETRRRIEQQILDEYERVLGERGETPEVGRRRLDANGSDWEDDDEDERDDQERQSALAQALRSPAAARPQPRSGDGSAVRPPLAAADAAGGSDRDGSEWDGSGRDDDGDRRSGETDGSGSAAGRVGDEVGEVHPVAARGEGDGAEPAGGDGGVEEPQGGSAAVTEGSGGGEPSPDEGDDPEGAKTLEEVEAMHLRDSFWSVS